MNHIVPEASVADGSWLNGITAGDDQFYGNNYGDFILAGTGNDSVYGNGGADILSGDAGNDMLSGDTGDDLLFGGFGKDILKGGDGYDWFVFDTKAATSNVDKIQDFSTVFDMIAFDNAIYTKVGRDGALSSGAFWKSKSGKAHDKSDRIIYETDTGKLFYDADGSGKGAAVQIASLSKKLALSHKDFWVL